MIPDPAKASVHAPRHLGNLRRLRRVCAVAALTLTACDPRLIPSDAMVPADTVELPDSPPRATDSVHATFAVASDIHFLSPRLVEAESSPSLQAYQAGDRKMVIEGPSILHSWLDSMRSLRPDFVLLTGDLTLDGEKASHEDLADSLGTLVDQGIKVVVLPGNHDVGMSPAAFTATGAIATEGVSAADFARIYARCGYGQAIARDSTSLSYVTEPVPGLRVVAIDGCSYRDLPSYTSRSCNYVQPSTRTWLAGVLARAKADGALLVGGLHFGTIPHFAAQATESVGSGYILSDAEATIRGLVSGGLLAVFTGHFHATDIATKAVEGRTWVDIETGSLVTPPCAFRTGRIADGRLSVRKHRIREITRDLGGLPFPEYADALLYTNFLPRMTNLMAGYGLESADATTAGQLLSQAWMTHYAGDEPAALPYGTRAVLAAWELPASSSSRRRAAALIRSFHTDPAPADSSGTFALR